MSEDRIIDLSTSEDPTDYRGESAHLLARIVTDLAERGVVPKLISVHDYYELYGGTTEVELFDAMVEWLIAEKVVREAAPPLGDDEDATVLHRTLVLTAFGFEALERKNLQGFTLRDELKKAAAQPRLDFSRIGELIGGALGGFAKSAG